MNILLINRLYIVTMNNPSPEHQGLLLALLRHLRDKLNISILAAAYSGFYAPSAYGRHEPDIVGRDSSGLLHLAEAKIEEDLDSQTTKEQFYDFANRSMTSDGRSVPFHIIVPTSARTKTETVLIELGLGDKIGSGITIWTA